MKNSFENGFFSNDTEVTVPDGLRNLRRAVKTVLIVPPHVERTHLSMKEHNIADDLPLQPPRAAIATDVFETVSRQADAAAKPALEAGRLISLASALIQFTDHVPTLRPVVQTPYTHIESMYNAFVNRAGTNGPLTFADQLRVGLEQNDGQLPDALWQLFMASRFYSRRRDGNALPGLPVLDDKQKLDTMVSWQNSLAACTAYDPEGYQDAAGDTYYTWTHALAKVAFSQFVERPNGVTRAAGRIFHSGANVMQAYVNTLYKEGSGATNRDHLPAASYGNDIGDACLEALAQA